MNVHLTHVISAISGVTGLAMIRALLAGARDPATLAACTDDRLNASPHTLANSLEGHWREAWLFHLCQSLERDEVDQQTIAACDARIEAHLHPCDSKLEVPTNPAPTSKRRPTNARRHAPHVARHTQRYRLSGVALTRMDGIEVLTAHTLIAEIGLEMSRWKTEQHCASGLG